MLAPLACAGLFATALTTSTATAAPMQGEYVNYEVAASRPIAHETFTDGGVTEDLVMVCNTANHALEFYRTNATANPSRMALVKSVPTGQSPVTVRFDHEDGVAYTCNHIGDSITKISVTPMANGAQLDFEIVLEGTYPVGDEPTDIAVLPAGIGANATPRALIVTLKSRSGVAQIDPVTMQIVKEREVLSTKTSSAARETYSIGVKNPVSIAHLDGHLYVLDKHSDEADLPDDTDQLEFLGFPINPAADDKVDLFASLSSSPASIVNPLDDDDPLNFKIGTLGTTHHQMVLNSSGSRMFVVGLRSLPQASDQEDMLAALPMGFSQSWLWSLSRSRSGVLRVGTEGPTIGSSFSSINLNRDYDATTPDTEVADSETLSQPTGLGLYEPGGVFSKIVVAAVSSDRIAVLERSVTSSSGWDVEVLDLTPVSAGYAIAGPRDVAVDSTTGLAYVACSFDNTIRIIDITGSAPIELETVPLAADPTPFGIRIGRDFLYSARHSATGTVSCASCHVDGHTDGLSWTLLPGDTGVVPDEFIDVPSVHGAPFQADKGQMVTQTLRGLVNYPITGEGQELATNAPYHWRGDRASLQDFNVAFDVLLGGDLLDQRDLQGFENFVESIMHPPNPEQEKDRRLTGELGVTNSTTRLWDPTEGFGQLQGLKVYHAMSQRGMSCAQCHVLPEGSGNTATEGSPGFPIETAALRHLFDREPIVMQGGLAIPTDPVEIRDLVRVKTTGLFHDGTVDRQQSINHFVEQRFKDDMPGHGISTNVMGMPGFVETSAWITDSGTLAEAARQVQAESVTDFVRALDTGSAPMIGHAFTFGSTASSNQQQLNEMIFQVNEANVGIVLHTEIENSGGVLVSRSYWYDRTVNRFKHEGPSPETRTRNYFTNNKGTQSQNTVVAEAVPVGAARSIAARGVPINDVPSIRNPSSLVLLPMAMPTQWEFAGQLKAFWDKDFPLTFFGDPSQDLEERRALKAQIDLQEAILTAQGDMPPIPPVTVQFGLEGKKHEPPRRFRVSGKWIRPGATLVIEIPDGAGGIKDLKVPIFPTSRLNGTDRIWESAIEIDGRITLALLCGGPFISSVEDILDFKVPDPLDPLDPIGNNSYTFHVKNLDGNQGSSSGRITVQNTRW